MSGGKGGQNETTQTVKLDPFLQGVAEENLALAQKVGQQGYVPYSGPTVAGFSQPQVSAMRNTDSAANAFGLAGNSVVMDPNTGQPISVGGMSMGQQVPGSGGYGYSAMPMYEQALANMPQGQADFIKQFFIDPQSGAAPTFDFASLRPPPPATPIQQVANMMRGGGGGGGNDNSGNIWYGYGNGSGPNGQLPENYDPYNDPTVVGGGKALGNAIKGTGTRINSFMGGLFGGNN
jgi:hypothetical protein